MTQLELKNLHVSLEDGTEIVKGVDLTVKAGEVHGSPRDRSCSTATM